MDIIHTGRLLMSNVISSFLVGIGFDYDKKSAKQIEGGIDTIKSKALQLGAVVAGGFGLKSLTADFASSADMLGKFSQVFGVNANEIQAFGNALATEGGTLESFMNQIESIERARARIRVGDVGFFAPAGKAGLDPNVIANANNATDAYLALADSFRSMNNQQRINAAEALGLDESSIRLLSQGRDAVEGLVSKYRNIQPLTGQMTDDAAEFNRQWVEASANIKGVANAISADLLPVINDITKQINGWFGENRQELIKDIGAGTSFLFGNPTSNQAARVMDMLHSIDVSAGVSEGPRRYSYPIPDNDPFLPDWLTTPFNNLFDLQLSNPFASQPDPFAPRMIEQDASTSSMTQKYKTTTNQPIQSNVNISLNLDGSVLDRRTVKIVDGMAQTAIDDISSNTGG